MTLTDAQVERLALAIETHGERIREGLDMVATALVRPPQAPVSEGPCGHPKEAREDAGSTMRHVRWACTVCGYRHDEAIGAARLAAQG